VLSGRVLAGSFLIVRRAGEMNCKLWREFFRKLSREEGLFKKSSAGGKKLTQKFLCCRLPV
jgi:hypothetical protein